MKFKKFLRSLIILVILAALLVPVGYKEYQRLMKQNETREWVNSFVPQEVSPYQENPDAELYYYKSIGGEQYFPDNWYGVPSRSEEGPSCIILDGVDVTEQTRYDSFVKTVIFPNELMEQLSVGDHWVEMFDEEDTSYCGYTLHVLEECTFNVPMLHAFLYTHHRQLIYSKEANNDITLYFNNTGDNPIVNVIRFKIDAWDDIYTPVEYLAPEYFTVSEAGNKVTISGAYFSEQSTHYRVSLGFRLADGTIIEPEDFHIWVLENDWDGFVITDMKDSYSLSSGEDYAVHYQMQNSTIFFGFSIVNITDGQYTVYLDYTDVFEINRAGEKLDYVDLDAKSITLPAEFMASLPAGQYMLNSSHWFGRATGVSTMDEGLYAYCTDYFEVIP